MTEVDQYIPSLAGEAQPDLLDASFPKLGRLKVNNPSAYRADLRKVSIQPGECHTFAFWGVSRMVDLIEWKLQTIPFVKNTSMDAINGAPPVVLTIYVLNPGGEGETRHLDSRMAVLWKTALWSTKYPPSPERLNALQAAITASGHDIMMMMMMMMMTMVMMMTMMMMMMMNPLCIREHQCPQKSKAFPMRGPFVALQACES